MPNVDNLVVVLHRPRDVVNIGGVVRAMKNTGLTRLRLVDPVPFDQADITGIAHRSEDVLARLGIFDTLEAALEDTVYVVGTSARARGEHPLRSDIRVLACELRERATSGVVALVFGPEDNGLDNDALDRCHALLRLPINPEYPSLNLAQAVLLVGYELWMAEGEEARSQKPEAGRREPATSEQLETLFDEAERALQAIQFFKSGAAPTMRVLRQIAFRAGLETRETKLLTAIAREVQRFVERRSG